MTFSDTTSKNGLIQDIEMRLSMGDATISGNTTLLKQFTSLINQAYHRTVAEILRAQTTWEWDDTNYTDFPIATKTLVDNQSDYKLPAASNSADGSTLLKLTKVQVKDLAGYYYNLKPIDESQIDGALTSVYLTKGAPQWYREIGPSIELYPAPDTTQVTASAGLKIFFQRSPSEFVSTDTTKQPGFAIPFHQLLSIQACLDYAQSRGMENAPFFEKQRDELLESLRNFYAERNKDNRIRLQARHTRANPNYN